MQQIFVSYEAPFRSNLQKNTGPAGGHGPHFLFLVCTCSLRCTTTACSLFFFTAGSVCRSAQHQPHHPEAARNPQAWDEGLLCQVQRPDLHQAGEAGHYDPADQPGQHCPGRCLLLCAQHTNFIIPVGLLAMASLTYVLKISTTPKICFLLFFFFAF